MIEALQKLIGEGRHKAVTMKCAVPQCRSDRLFIRPHGIEGLKVVSCLERGTLDAVLKQCGFSYKAGKKKLPTNGNYIEVPIPFSADTRRTACPA